MNSASSKKPAQRSHAIKTVATSSAHGVATVAGSEPSLKTASLLLAKFKESQTPGSEVSGPMVGSKVDPTVEADLVYKRYKCPPGFMYYDSLQEVLTGANRQMATVASFKNQEWGAWVYLTEDGKYALTAPDKGGSDWLDIEDNELPEIPKVILIGYYHVHPTGPYRVSPADKDMATKLSARIGHPITVWAGTLWGQLEGWNPKDGYMFLDTGKVMGKFDPDCVTHD